MHTNFINYELACRNCRTIRIPTMAYFETEEKLEYMSREELIDKMNNFEHIQCKHCGKYGNWILLKIYLNNNDDVLEQFTINIFKENGKITGNVESGNYSDDQIDMAFMNIKNNIEKLKGYCYPTSINAGGLIIVDFLKNAPYSRVSVFEIEGFSINEISGFIDFLIKFDFRQYW